MLGTEGDLRKKRCQVVPQAPLILHVVGNSPMSLQWSALWGQRGIPRDSGRGFGWLAWVKASSQRIVVTLRKWKGLTSTCLCWGPSGWV